MAKNYNDIYTAVYTKNNKMDFGNSMIRGNGIPLDITEVYNSYAAAESYVNSNPVAYEGQILAVTENNDTTVYVIAARLAADGESVEHYLKPVGSVPDVDGKTIIINNEGKLEAAIPEFEDTNTTYELKVEGVEGGIKITLTPSEGEAQSYTINDPDLSDYITSGELTEALANKADKSDVYTKTETDKKIGDAVAAADHLKRKIVDSVEDIDITAADAMQYIYMVPSGLQASDNKYYEYIVLEENGNKYVEQVGSWEVDLTAYLTKAAAEETYAKKNDVEATYAKKTDIPTDYVSTSEFSTEIAKYETAEVAAGKYVAQEEGKTLIEVTELERLAQVNENAEENYISSVDENKFTVTDGRLELKELTEYAKASDVYTKSEIDTKIGIPGIPEEKGEDGSVIQEAVPGTGVYQNVYSKDEITDLIADITGGESAADVKAELTAYKTSNDAAVNGLASRVGEVETKITSLETLLNGKADKETVEDLASSLGDIDTRVSSLETVLNNYVTISMFNTAINDINDRLTWKTLSE